MLKLYAGNINTFSFPINLCLISGISNLSFPKLGEDIGGWISVWIILNNHPRNLDLFWSYHMYFFLTWFHTEFFRWVSIQNSRQNLIGNVGHLVMREKKKERKDKRKEKSPAFSQKNVILHPLKTKNKNMVLHVPQPFKTRATNVCFVA